MLLRFKVFKGLHELQRPQDFVVWSRTSWYSLPRHSVVLYWVFWGFKGFRGFCFWILGLLGFLITQLEIRFIATPLSAAKDRAYSESEDSAPHPFFHLDSCGWSLSLGHLFRV